MCWVQVMPCVTLSNVTLSNVNNLLLTCMPVFMIIRCDLPFNP